MKGVKIVGDDRDVIPLQRNLQVQVREGSAWRTVGELKGATRKRDVDFYEGQIKTAEFFIHTILPTTLGKMNGIVKCNGAAVEISEAAFGG